jgi:hypothetical protein
MIMRYIYELINQKGEREFFADEGQALQTLRREAEVLVERLNREQDNECSTWDIEEWNDERFIVTIENPNIGDGGPEKFELSVTRHSVIQG